MARDKGNFYEASDWFKEALQINQVVLIDVYFSNSLTLCIEYIRYGMFIIISIRLCQHHLLRKK